MTKSIWHCFKFILNIVGSPVNPTEISFSGAILIVDVNKSCCVLLGDAAIIVFPMERDITPNEEFEIQCGSA